MIIEFLKKYLSILFILATFMGVFHHHNDLKPHHECQICTIESIIADIDLPQEHSYLENIDTEVEVILTSLSTQEQEKRVSTLQARAPPTIS